MPDERPIEVSVERRDKEYRVLGLSKKTAASFVEELARQCPKLLGKATTNEINEVIVRDDGPDAIVIPRCLDVVAAIHPDKHYDRKIALNDDVLPTAPLPSVKPAKESSPLFGSSPSAGSLLLMIR